MKKLRYYGLTIPIMIVCCIGLALYGVTYVIDKIGDQLFNVCDWLEKKRGKL